MAHYSGRIIGNVATLDPASTGVERVIPEKQAALGREYTKVS
ncbi:MAG TPA: hypothetical protein VFQ78_11855 [Candidatus Udaeobacter sp.]|nr:hypothetical protein [Candidatus Udaeobacter sp.]